MDDGASRRLAGDAEIKGEKAYAWDPQAFPSTHLHMS